MTKRRRRTRRKISLGAVSKGDFVAIAKILSSECAPARVVQRIADYFGNQNPRFATDKFLTAASCKR